jgi:hypothetical protein
VLDQTGASGKMAEEGDALTYRDGKVVRFRSTNDTAGFLPATNLAHDVTTDSSLDTSCDRVVIATRGTKDDLITAVYHTTRICAGIFVAGERIGYLDSI